MSIGDFEGFVDPFEEGTNEDNEQLWTKQQKNTFTAWCNSHLRKVNINIKAIDEDLRDGYNLMKLIEVISGEMMPKLDRGKMKVHKVTNVNKCLQFIQSKGVKLVSVGAEEIVDGNVKMTLGMIWTIILRFAIQDIMIDDICAKEGLLLWCQRKTSPYKNVRVNNFHMSFKDGLAFCALIHRHRPDLIDYKSLSRENAAHNLNLAFDIAEKHLDIPRMLDVEDMVNNVKPDELSVMAYVSSYYHAFSGAHKAETASNRICNVINFNQDNESMIDNFNISSSDLINWIDNKIKSFRDRSESCSVDDMKKKCDEFREYRETDKPPKLEERGKLESDFNTLQTRLRLSNRPTFVPKDGHSISDVNSRWKELERNEKDYEDWLMSDLKRIEQIDHLVKNFNLRCNTHESWSNGKLTMLKEDSYKTANISELRAIKKKQEAFESDFIAHSSRIDRIRTIAEELRKLKFRDMASIDGRLSPINEEWREIAALIKSRNEVIEKLYNILEEIDKLHLDYAKTVAPFFNWVEQSKEDLQDSHILHYIDEVKLLIGDLDSFKSSMNGYEDKFNELENIDSRIKKMSHDNLLTQIKENPYTLLEQRTIDEEWKDLKELIPIRDEFLQKELKRQIENENLRNKFIKLANKLGPWIDLRQTKLNFLVTEDMDSTLEEQKKQLEDMEVELTNTRKLAEEVSLCNEELHQNLIFKTPNCSYSMEVLRVSWEQLQSSIRTAKTEVDNQILTRNSKGISNTQMDEFRRCFNHFDKNRTRTLEPMEFKACLISLGFNIKDGNKANGSSRKMSTGEVDFSVIMKQADPYNSGVITFESFIDYLAKETTEQDTMEQTIKSFRVLAQDMDFITTDQLRRELPSEQAEYCIANMVPYPEGGPEALDYHSFAASLYGLSDL